MTILRTSIATLALCLTASFAAGQGNPTGTISGRVAQADGAVLPGVTVVAASPALQGTREVVSSEHGDFILPFLPPGEYTVRFELASFKPVEQQGQRRGGPDRTAGRRARGRRRRRVGHGLGADRGLRDHGAGRDDDPC